MSEEADDKITEIKTNGVRFTMNNETGAIKIVLPKKTHKGISFAVNEDNEIEVITPNPKKVKITNPKARTYNRDDLKIGTQMTYGPIYAGFLPKEGKRVFVMDADLGIPCTYDKAIQDLLGWNEATKIHLLSNKKADGLDNDTPNEPSLFEVEQECYKFWKVPSDTEFKIFLENYNDIIKNVSDLPHLLKYKTYWTQRDGYDSNATSIPALDIKDKSKPKETTRNRNDNVGLLLFHVVDYRPKSKSSISLAKPQTLDFGK